MTELVTDVSNTAHKEEEEEEEEKEEDDEEEEKEEEEEGICESNCVTQIFQMYVKNCASSSVVCGGSVFFEKCPNSINFFAKHSKNLGLQL